MRAFVTAWAVILSIPLASTIARSDEGVAEGPPRRVFRTNQEWARTLTGMQYLVTRMKATEPPFTGRYVHNHARGTYLCVCCGAELFSSTAKYESGTGWPSFWRPIEAGRLATAPDYSGAEARVEVNCATCDAHLGHIFGDGPPPTGWRFCINSVALKFVPESSAAGSGRSPRRADDPRAVATGRAAGLSLGAAIAHAATDSN